MIGTPGCVIQGDPGYARDRFDGFGLGLGCWDYTRSVLNPTLTGLILDARRFMKLKLLLDFGLISKE